jgi:hypothetical protein
VFELSVMLRGRLVGTSRFDQETVRIGRTPDNEVFVDNPVFSRSHAVIQRRGIVHVLQDLKTSNGTFLNGKKVSVANLNDGDRITIGKFTLVFSCPEARAAAVPVPGCGAATVALDIRGRASDLERNARTRAALLVGSDETYPLDRDVFLVGHDRVCDLLAGSWRTPRLAMIARGHGGFSLVNAAGHSVLQNGKPVPWQSWLKDGDRLELGGVAARFVLERDVGARHAPTPVKALNESLSVAIKKAEGRHLIGLLERWFDRHG